MKAIHKVNTIKDDWNELNPNEPELTGVKREQRIVKL